MPEELGGQRCDVIGYAVYLFVTATTTTTTWAYGNHLGMGAFNKGGRKNQVAVGIVRSGRE